MKPSRLAIIAAVAPLLALSAAAKPKHKKAPPMPPQRSHGMLLSRVGCEPIGVGESGNYVLYAYAEYGPQHKREWQHNLGTFQSNQIGGGITMMVGPAQQTTSSWGVYKADKMHKACINWLRQVQVPKPQKPGGRSG